MKLNHEAMQRQFEVYYADKRTAFSELMKKLVNSQLENKTLMITKRFILPLIMQFSSAIQTPKNSLFLLWNGLIKKSSVVDAADRERILYTSLITTLGRQLNQELESTKPVIKCE